MTYSECVFVAFYAACKARTSNIVICGLSGSTIFFPPNFLVNDTMFGKKKTGNKMFISIFFYKLFLNISHSKKSSAKYIIIVRMSTCKMYVILVRF
jgi:hypothetical protein